jgi:RND family efflux transporter MFP subunit
MTANDHENDSGTSPPSRLKGLPSAVKTLSLMVLGGIIVAAAAFLTGVYPPHDSDHASDSAAAQGGAQLWTCGMHPEVIQEEPGICPICHMDLTPLRDSGQDMTEEHADQHESAAQLWTCGMHPQVVEEQPGQCPICGMDLVPLHNDESAADSSRSEREILFYRSPMNPGVTSQVPRKDDMGMDFVPVYSDEAASAAAQGATVTIDPATVQNMNVTTQMVERRDVTRQIRTVGYLEYDQERMVSITTKYAGFIEKVYINYIGQPVEAGQPLFEIYSPELVQTQQELLSVLRYARQMAGTDEETRRRAESLLESAHERLRYWDITEEQIAELERTDQVVRTLKVVAPSSGVVMKRMPGLEGMAVRPGMELLHIADLRNLWLTVEVFENQLSWVNVGSQATVTLTYFPGKSIRGRVRFIEPEVSEKTRSLRLTLEVPNHDARLRVGMYATVLFEPVTAKNALTVPSNAILRTGTRNVAIVALGEGRFAPREVQLGPEGDGFVQVAEGLEDGEEIVTSSQFLIDSESNLREAIQKMIAARRAQANRRSEDQLVPSAKY